MLIAVLLLVSYAVFTYLINHFLGFHGLGGSFFENGSSAYYIIYLVAISHITITCMSLSFHRYHTHKGVIFNKGLDTFMQVWLWLVTSMSKLDWVSVHLYHHKHSDKEKDPHSPVAHGLAHVLFLGVIDYTKAKNSPEVIKLRNNIKRSKLEQFISENLLVGPFFLSAIFLLIFGLKWGTILSITNFMISPVFAVGGVNALAHWYGYKNHQSNDNSTNLGFIFPLNFIICGELDHNNHHAHPQSCSFRHKWYEFDIGYFYIKLLSAMKLAEIKNAYNPTKMKVEMSKRVMALIENDKKMRERCELLAKELKMSYMELRANIVAYFEGKKVLTNKKMDELIAEIQMMLKDAIRFNPQFN
jgi:stearoyl-CoA desaturase (delta-9 desaturase)